MNKHADCEICNDAGFVRDAYDNVKGCPVCNEDGVLRILARTQQHLDILSSVDCAEHPSLSVALLFWEKK